MGVVLFLVALLGFPLGFLIGKWTKEELVVGKKYLIALAVFLFTLFIVSFFIATPVTSASLLFLLGLPVGSLLFMKLRSRS